ncbi:glycosyltransferase family 29 protein [Falsiroseomonas sp.]|uniref:glycosyltransferase family 29 protein n=1 Tax=Falsiroseomonas sp. TaxID=2870721 RepID=UPI00271E723C|nr:glycosyltransferase family 29 protein [Falsiroseomonas sp.]MDO9501203.1 glycosyltransferase family 29 protein [Falsiroseomonas sp.]
MSPNVLDVGAFRRAFGDLPEERRAEFLAEVLEPLATGLSGINGIVACVDIDAQSFRKGLELALERKPANLTAGRALIWHLIREGETDQADHLSQNLAGHFPSHRDLYAERIRTLLVGSPAKAAPAFEQVKHQLGETARLSYDLQCASVEPKGVPAAKVAAFNTVLRGAFLDMVNLPEKEHAVTLQEEERKALWQISERLLGARRVALVGNAPTLKGAGLGAEIDAHDLVIRCNFAEIEGFAADVGTRVDLVAFNETLRPSLERLRGRSGRYAEVPALGLHPIADFGASQSREPIPPGVATLPFPTRAFISAISYVRSTTGVMALNLLTLVFGKSVTAYGFDFFSDVSRPHYFGHQTGAYLGHEVQYERWFVTHFLPAVRPDRVHLVKPKAAD